MKIFWFLPIALFGQINKNGDFQIWERNFVKKHFFKEWTASAYAEFRWGDDASKLYYYFIQAQTSYIPASWFSLSPAYRQAWRRFPLNSHHWIPEYKPLLDATFKFSIYDWEFADRNRAEYTIVESEANHWVYRNRFRIITPLGIAKWTFNFYVENEIFIRERQGFNQDRLTAGFMSIIYDNLGGQIFYMARFLKGKTEWTEQNILGATLLLAY